MDRGSHRAGRPLLRWLALGLGAALLAGCRDSPPARPDVVLILIDTLRADALSAYGNPRNTSPHLDALAERGVLFERVIAPSSWTKTSMASIFTSRNPLRHGLRGVKDVLPAKLPTLVQAFAAAGYRTLGINTNPWLTEEFGFQRGFERYQTAHFAPASQVNRIALSMLHDSDERPIFLYVHYMDVHAPYTPERRFFDAPPLNFAGHGESSDSELEDLYRNGQIEAVEIPQRLHARYEAEVRQLDEDIGHLFEALDARGILEGGVQLITSDHGEAFGEHGWAPHGETLYPEVLRVPLILCAPGRLPRGERVPQQVRSIDVAPTLLALAGITPPAEFDGRSLLPLNGERDADRVAVSAVGLNDAIPELDLVSVMSPEYLLIRERRSDAVELYDLGADPQARHALSPGNPEVERLSGLVGPEVTLIDEQVELDQAARERLRALGYLDGER